MSAAGVMGPVWLWARREAVSGVARELSARERGVLGACFDAQLLRDVRVAEVERIDEPAVFEVLSAAGLQTPMDFGGVSGICFGDVVAVRRETMTHGDLSTLFHELVHAVQVRRMGASRFCRAYVRGWLEEGYPALELEAEAYTLQARFDRGEVFEVR